VQVYCFHQRVLLVIVASYTNFSWAFTFKHVHVTAVITAHSTDPHQPPENVLTFSLVLRSHIDATLVRKFSFMK
jgi:hypothetical protein